MHSDACMRTSQRIMDYDKNIPQGEKKEKREEIATGCHGAGRFTDKTLEDWKTLTVCGSHRRIVCGSIWFSRQAIP